MTNKQKSLKILYTPLNSLRIFYGKLRDITGVYRARQKLSLQALRAGRKNHRLSKLLYLPLKSLKFLYRILKGSKRHRRRALAVVLTLLIILTSIRIWPFIFPPETEAAWFDDNYAYRQSYTFTHNAALTDQAVTFTLDTAELITDGVMQSDCDDTRFTDVSGRLLLHDITGTACNNAATTYEVIIPSVINGDHLIYVYYGNPSAVNVEIDSSTYTALTPSGGDPSAITNRTNEEIGPGPALYFKFDEGVDNTCSGGANDVCDNSPNSNDGAFNNSPTWQTEDMCLDGKCVNFDGTNDYVSVTDNSTLDITNTGTIQAWVRSHDDTSAESSFGSWTSLTAPDGVADAEDSEVDITIVGNKIYYAALLHVGATETFSTANSDLDGSNMTSWTDQTDPDGAGGSESTSIAIDSDGVSLYYAAFAHTISTESFYTASSNLDGTGFSGWTDQADPDGAGSTDRVGIDMVVVDDKMYFAAYLHDDTTGEFSTANSNLDGSNFTGWTDQTNPTGASVSSANKTDVAIDSDGVRLYYAAYANLAHVSQDFDTTSSALDGSDFQSWTSQTASSTTGGNGESDGIDMTIVGSKMYFASFILDNSGNETYETANADLDGTNMTSWTTQTNPGGGGINDGVSSSIATDGKNLYYSAFAHDDAVETLNVTSSTVTSHPVISKTDAYELIQTGGGFVFDWAGSPKSFGSISASEWNHVAVTLDGTDMIYYVNGVEVRRQTVTTDMASNANNLLIGGDGTRYFNGEMDEVKIYPYARSAAEIKSDVTRGASVHGVSASFGPDDSWLSDGLVGYWKMDDAGIDAEGETITDASGNGNSGTLYGDDSTGDNGTGMDCTASGKFGTGCDFDGTDDYVDAHGITSEIANDTQGTFAFWVYMDTDPNVDGVPFALGNSSSGQTFFELWFDFNDEDNLHIRVDSGNSTRWNLETGGNSLDPYIGQWLHIAITHDGTEPRIFFNGEVQGFSYNSQAAKDRWMKDLINDATTKLDQFRLAADGTGTADTFFDGSIDEFRIYNRALFPAEVRQLADWAPGPTHYWDFNEGSGTTIYDRGNVGGINGTFVGSPVWTTGRFGNGLDFDGTADYISISDTGDYSRPFTITAWAKTDTNASGARQIGLGDGQVQFYQAGGPTLRFRTSSDNTDIANVFTVGEWVHVTVTYDGSDIKLYSNGILGATETKSATDGNTLRIGAVSSGEYWNGVLDEVKIYNYARTPAQIIEDMNAGHPLGGSPIGSQTVYWALDEQYGTTANDTIGNSNGTIAGANWLLQESCKVNACLNFDAATEAITIATASDSYVDFEGSEPFSGSAWVYPVTMPGAGEQDALIVKWDSTTATSEGYRLILENDDADATGNFQVEISDESAGQVITATGANDTVSQNTWYHVLFTFNGGTAGTANDLKLYVNGVNVDGNSANALFLGLENVTSDFTVGEYDTNDVVATNTAFTGRIDEVKIYGAELTSDQVLIDMNAGSNAAFSVLGSSEASDLADGAASDPVGYWNFNENTGTSTAVDISGNGNDLTLTSIAEGGWVRGPNGFGSAIEFDGSADYASRTDDADFDFAAADDFTVSGWFKHVTISAADYILTKAQAGTNAGYKIYMASDGDIVFEIDDDSTWDPDDSVTTTAATYDDGAWHHFAAVKDDTTAIYIYIDGVQIASDTSIAATGTLANDDILYVGVNDDGSSNPFAGSLDEIKIHNVALTQAQIAYEYNRGAPVGWWQFDECQGTTAYDASGNSNNGTITIGATGSNTSAGTCSSGTGTEAWDNGTTGKRNASLDFDGTDDYVEASTQLVSGYPFTMSAWYKTTGTSVAAFSLADASVENVLYVLTTESGGSARLLVNDGTTSNNTNGNSSINDDNWHYVVGVLASASDRKLYIDGVLENSTGTSVTYNTNVDTWSIGRRGDSSPSQYFDGQIDDVRIYNYALSANQILKIMNEGAVRFGPATGSP